LVDRSWLIFFEVEIGEMKRKQKNRRDMIFFELVGCEPLIQIIDPTNIKGNKNNLKG
jgi:hypothetical protein